MGKIWTGEEKSLEHEPPACSHTLLRGQTLIGHDGRLTKTSGAQGEPEQKQSVKSVVDVPSKGYAKMKSRIKNYIKCVKSKLFSTEPTRIADEPVSFQCSVVWWCVTITRVL